MNPIPLLTQVPTEYTYQWVANLQTRITQPMDDETFALTIELYLCAVFMNVPIARPRNKELYVKKGDQK